MLQYSTYSVISPEGCASILWKSADKAPLAAEAMAITSDKLKDLELIDEIIPEPLGGAHRDIETMANNLKHALLTALENLQSMAVDKLLDTRYQRLMQYGQYTGGE
jgi:acetyl-CoA carboxylase carboxyl transferase subunit alpha